MDAVAYALASGIKANVLADEGWVAKKTYTTGIYNGFGYSINNIGYSVGGTTDGASVANNHVAYDPLTDTWSTKATTTAKRNQTGFVLNNKFYQVGGYLSGATRADTVEEYDPATNSWASKAVIPGGGRMEAAGWRAASGKGYIYGGNDSNGTSTGATHEYTAETNTWTVKATGTAREQMAVFVLDGYGYAAGGIVLNSVVLVDYLQRYNHVSNSWNTYASLPVKAQEPNGFAHKGKGYAVCQYNQNELYEFDPSQNKWVRKQNLPVQRNNGMSFELNGYGYYFGGREGSTTVGKMHMYQSTEVELDGVELLLGWLAAN